MLTAWIAARNLLTEYHPLVDLGPKSRALRSFDSSRSRVFYRGECRRRFPQSLI